MRIIRGVMAASVLLVETAPLAAQVVTPSSDTITVAGAPRTFQVVAVPVPAAAGRGVRYRVTPMPGARAIGAESGVVDPTNALDGRLLVTLAIAPSARAGRSGAGAVVFFWSSSDSGITVPIVLDVTRVRRIVVQPVRIQTGARADSRVRVAFVVTNAGNAPDTVRAGSDQPSGWRVIEGARSAILDAGASTTDTCTLAIPPSTSGDITVTLRASTTAGVELARAGANIEVIDDGGSRARAFGVGPVVTVGAAAAAGGGPIGTGGGVTVSGLLTDDVALTGRWVSTSTHDVLSNIAYADLGYVTTPPYLIATAPRWSLGAGATSLTLSPLAGTSMWGLGASGIWHDTTWHVRAVAARPGEVTGVSHYGAIAGLGVERRFGAVSVFVDAAHLLDSLAGRRRLDAANVGATIEGPAGFVSTADVGARETDAGTALGYAVGIDRSTRTSDLSLREIHAPGGSQAFAVASDQQMASGYAQLTGAVTMIGAAWRAADANAIFARAVSDGWTVGPQFRVTGSTSARIDYRMSASTETGSLGGFADRDQAGELTLSTFWGRLTATATASAGVTTQSTIAPAGASDDATGPRVLVSALVTHPVGGGAWSVFGTVDHAGIPGAITDQSVFGARVNELHPLPTARQLTIGAMLARSGLFGTGPRYTTFEWTTHYRPSDAYDLAVAVEHYPVAVLVMPSTWAVALRIQRSFRLPGIPRPGASGTVFTAGIAPGNNTGLQGVLLRRNGETVITNALGVYHFHSASADAPVLDPASLPVGLLSAGPVSTGGAAGRFDFPIVATGDVTVRLVVVRDALSSAPPLAVWRGAAITAIDEVGRVWTARPDADGVATFKALPIATYHLDVDLSRTAEPMRVSETLPAVVVTRSPDPQDITVHVRRRAIKLHRFDVTAS